MVAPMKAFKLNLIPTFLEKMVAAINETGADIAYCGWQNIGLSGPCGEPYIPPDYQRMSNKIEKLLAEPGWPVHAAIIKKKTLFDEGIFNTTLKSGEDFDLWLRTALSNTIVLVPEVLSYYRHHENQMTSHRSLIALTHLAVQQEFLKNHQELVKRLGYKKIRELTIGGLLKKGYVCYWDRELFAAREIFCVVMKYGYGKLKDWKYMLPSILSYSLHAFLLRQIDS